MSLFLMTFVSECESYNNPKRHNDITRSYPVANILFNSKTPLNMSPQKKTNKRKYKQTKTGKPQNASVTPLNCQIYFTSEGGLM